MLQLVEQNLQATKGMDSTKAKLGFLHILCQWPTYGSVFFQVKVSTPKSPTFATHMYTVIHGIEPTRSLCNLWSSCQHYKCLVIFSNYLLKLNKNTFNIQTIMIWMSLFTKEAIYSVQYFILNMQRLLVSVFCCLYKWDIGYCIQLWIRPVLFSPYRDLRLIRLVLNLSTHSHFITGSVI